MDATGPLHLVSDSTNALPPVRSAWTSTAPGDQSSSTGHDKKSHAPPGLITVLALAAAYSGQSMVDAGQAMMDSGSGMMGNG